MLKKVLSIAVCGVLTTSLVAVHAQQSGEFKLSSPKVTYRENGARMDGNAKQPATIRSPQLDVTALTIAFDTISARVNGKQQTQLKEVRALTNVKIRATFPGKNGGPATRIETSSDTATLDARARKLTLKGKVDGYYQTGQEPRVNLAGDYAIIQQDANGQVSGDFSSPKVVIPAEQTGKPDALGSVTITADKGTLDQQKGTMIFSGNARAVSNDTANKFDVAAPQFTLKRGADGQIDTLTTQGRTLSKFDLPANQAGAESTSSEIGRPTRIEVESDSAIVERATSKLTFLGNVKGFYVLSPAGQPEQKYDFNGDKAVLVYAPDAQTGRAGLNAEITGQPVTIFAPPVTFGDE